MKRESKQEREAWTAFVDGEVAKENKYGVSPKDERGKYASKYEAAVAQNLDVLFRAGEIIDLSEQVPFTLVEGKGKIRPIKYIADFVYYDRDGLRHVCDAKGMKTPVYRLKRKLMFLLHGITVEEL